MDKASNNDKNFKLMRLPKAARINKNLPKKKQTFRIWVKILSYGEKNSFFSISVQYGRPES